MNFDRRDFLKGALATGAIAAGGAALAGCAPTQQGASSSGGSSSSGEYMTAELANRKWAFELPPEPITDIAETLEADVVVVGSGTSGLVTAYSALKQGLKVIVVSASSKPISRGGSNNAVYSKHMEKEGFAPQKPDYILKEMAMNNNNVDHRKWYKYFQASEEAMNWVIDIMEGAGFQTAIERTANMTPDSIFYTAPSAHGWVNDEERTVGMTQPFVVNTFAEKILAEGGEIFYKNIGRQLVRGEDNATGRVSAVICEREDGSFAQYSASKAVVLATGDFSANREMMTKYAPEAAKMVSDELYDAKEVDYDKEFVFGGLFPGDGQSMGLWVGAAWQKAYPNAPMGATINAGATPNPYQNFWGLIVNREGARFMNEYCTNIMGGRAQYLQPGGESYAIWDVDYSNLPDWYPGQGAYGILEKATPQEVIEIWEKSVSSGAYVKADTLEDLLKELGLPDEAKATVDRYNELCAAKEDKDFFKRAENLFPIKNPPFYGQKASGTPGLLTILGGLRTDDNMRVCDEDDNPIEGLYNVGTMVGDFYSGFYTFQMEGINYGACCLTFGYLTGKFIAENE